MTTTSNKRIILSDEVKSNMKCRSCSTPATGLKWSYYFNPYGTHAHTKCGWWLRVTHKWEVVTALKCEEEALADARLFSALSHIVTKLQRQEQLIILNKRSK